MFSVNNCNPFNVFIALGDCFFFVCWRTFFLHTWKWRNKCESKWRVNFSPIVLLLINSFHSSLLIYSVFVFANQSRFHFLSFMVSYHSFYLHSMQHCISSHFRHHKQLDIFVIAVNSLLWLTCFKFMVWFTFLFLMLTYYNKIQCTQMIWKYI